MSCFVEGLGEHGHATEPFVLEVLPDGGRPGVRRGGGEDDEPDRDVSGSGRGQMLVVGLELLAGIGFPSDARTSFALHHRNGSSSPAMAKSNTALANPGLLYRDACPRRRARLAESARPRGSADRRRPTRHRRCARRRCASSGSYQPTEGPARTRLRNCPTHRQRRRPHCARHVQASSSTYCPDRERRRSQSPAHLSTARIARPRRRPSPNAGRNDAGTWPEEPVEGMDLCVARAGCGAAYGQDRARLAVSSRADVSLRVCEVPIHSVTSRVTPSGWKHTHLGRKRCPVPAKRKRRSSSTSR
jgi:hypothetical protein